MKNTNTKAVKRIKCKVVLSDNSAKKIGLSSVDEIKKGALITLPCYPGGSQNYRILSVNGTQIKVMAMISIENSEFESGQRNCYSCSKQHYRYSDLDIKMAKIYDILPDGVKKAIIPQTIKQSMLNWSERYYPNAMFHSWYANNHFDEKTQSKCEYSCTKDGDVLIGQCNVYALDVDDIVDYLGIQFTPQQLNFMFFGVGHSVDEYVWLRSMSINNASQIYFVDGYDGSINDDSMTSCNSVRPAFVIDLAKLNT